MAVLSAAHQPRQARMSFLAGFILGWCLANTACGAVIFWAVYTGRMSFHCHDILQGPDA
jgi:hypothetical protein